MTDGRAAGSLLRGTEDLLRAFVDALEPSAEHPTRRTRFGLADRGSVIRHYYRDARSHETAESFRRVAAKPINKPRFEATEARDA